MAGWISSKLRDAENFLQRIDQQAAESLGKGDKPRSDDLNIRTPGVESNNKQSQEIPGLLNGNKTLINVNVRPDILKPIQGIKKSNPNASVTSQLENEVAVQRSLVKSHSPGVSKPLPDDWTELLASPDLGSSNNVGSSDAKSTALRSSKGKDGYTNGGVSNVGLTSLFPSKHLPLNLSHSKLGRESQQLDVSSSSKSLDSKGKSRHDSKLKQHAELDFASKLDVTASTRDCKVDAVPDSSLSIHGNGADSIFSSSVSTMGRDGRGELHEQTFGHINQPNKDAKQNLEAYSISSSKIFHSDLKEDSFPGSYPLDGLKESSSDSAFASDVNNTDICFFSENGSFAHKDVNLIGISQNGMQNAKSDSYSVSFEGTKINMVSSPESNGEGGYQHGMEKDRRSDEPQFQGDGMQGHYKQVQQIPAIQLDGVHESSLESDEGSETETETDSASGSDSEDDEVERRKQAQRKMAAEAAAEAAALEAAKTAIKEREEFVMRLEREKERMEQILAEREEQQAREAAELKMNMKESIQAVDLEKQKHNATRMQALARVAKLEIENADLAKSLAAVQRCLEVELGRVACLRGEIESKEVSQAELERRLSLLHHKLAFSNQAETSKGFELEEETFDEKHSHLCGKIEELQVKVKQMEENIQRTIEAWESPTEVEVELDRRLSQLTDSLIQKQAQVEALSTEKATLLFRLEALSNTIYEERYLAQSQKSKGKKSSILLDSVTMEEDLEFGMVRPYYSRTKEIYDREDFVRSPVLFFSCQMDMLISVCASYLRRYGLAKCIALVYLVALHIWVIFVLFLHNGENKNTKHGALFSLENINNATNSLNSTHP